MHRHKLKPFEQPVLLERNLTHVERATGHAQFDLWLRLGVEVAATKSRLAITGFNETLAVTVEGGTLTLACDGMDKIVSHHLRLGMRENTRLGQRLADGEHDSGYVADSIDTRKPRFHGSPIDRHPAAFPP